MNRRFVFLKVVTAMSTRSELSEIRSSAETMLQTCLGFYEHEAVPGCSVLGVARLLGLTAKVSGCNKPRCRCL